MLNTLRICGMEIPTFPLMAALGVLCMMLMLIFALKRRGESDCMEFVCVRLVAALAAGYFGAAVLDGLLKMKENGGFRLSGITFYGGLVAGLAAMYMLLTAGNKTGKKPLYWLNFLTVPFVVFHMFGRVGCFLGGCCYGKVTDSVFGLYFPDLPEHGILHYGEKVFPTQLFEAVGLLILALVLTKVAFGKRFVTYLVSYSVMRFMLEFLRGDDRGMSFGVFSPSQLVSMLILASVGVYLVLTALRKRNLIAEKPE